MMILLILSAVVSFTHAQEYRFETATYQVILNHDCETEVANCDDVSFTSNNKKTKRIEILRGKRLHATAENTGAVAQTDKTPFIFRFDAPNKQVRIITYDNRLLHLSHGKVVFQEKGSWTDNSRVSHHVKQTN